jgi:glycosyltransferase involved in cell wall biosynthesis
MNNPEISVIIPVKNAGSIFDECLAAVKVSQKADYEIIVIDDGSTDNTVDIANKHACQVISLPRSLGPANARNVGALQARGSIIFFIDADIVICNDMLHRLSNIFRDKRVVGITGILAGQIRYNDFYSQYKNLWMRYTFVFLPDTISIFNTSCTAIRRETFLESGGFDTSYGRPSVEDSDFARKFVGMGHVVHLRKDIEVEHVKSYTLLQILKTDFYRSSDLVKMTLRDGLKKSFSPRESSAPAISVPLTFVGGVGLFLLTVPPVLVGICASVSWWPYLLLCGISTALFFCLNYSFLKWLKQQRGLAFSIKSFLFLLFLDIPVVTMGIFGGLVDYCKGNKY